MMAKSMLLSSKFAGTNCMTLVFGNGSKKRIAVLCVDSHFTSSKCLTGLEVTAPAIVELFAS
jgi:hypothetical protein